MSMKSIARRLRGDHGAAAVEFAILAPVLLLLLFILVDVSRMGYVQISLNSAVRESVRASSFGLTLTEINTIANATSGKAAQMAGLSNTATVSTTQVRSCAASSTLGRTTEVSVSTLFKWITPVSLIYKFTPNSAFSSSATLTAKGVMVCAG